MDLGEAEKILAACRFAKARYAACLGIDGSTINQVCDVSFVQHHYCKLLTKHRQLSVFNVSTRIVSEENKSERLLLAGCRPQAGATAAAELAGVEQVFSQAQERVMAMRSEVDRLGGDSDELVPIVDGGVRMHKNKSVMHDTCNAANATARLIKKASLKDLKDFFSAAQLAALPAHLKLCLDLLCSNHLRVLPLVQYERFVDARIAAHLKQFLEKVSSFQRLEPRLDSTLRATNKMGRGWLSSKAELYSKGEGRFGLALTASKLMGTDDNLFSGTLGRNDHGSRFEWVCRSCWNLGPLLDLLVTHCGQRINMGGHTIIRASIFIRLSSPIFIAEIYAHSVVYDLVVKPMRALVNSSEANIDGVGIATYFQELFALGKTMTANPMYLVEQL